MNKFTFTFFLLPLLLPCRAETNFTKTSMTVFQEQLESNTDFANKMIIISNLEQDRSPAAVGLLKKELVNIQSPFVKGPQMQLVVGLYPCALSLIAIGAPAIPEMVDVILNSANQKERAVACYVLRGILGEQKSVSILHNVLVSQRTDGKIENVKEALTFLVDPLLAQRVVKSADKPSK